jgi:hypothetical protein
VALGLPNEVAGLSAGGPVLPRGLGDRCCPGVAGLRFRAAEGLRVAEQHRLGRSDGYLWPRSSKIG